MQYSYKATGLNTIDKANIQIEDNVFNVGLLLGYQVHLGKKVYLDCWLVGLGLRHSKVAGTAQTNFEMSQPLSYPQMYSFLEGIYNANLSYTINGTQTSFVGESWQPAFRGGGICIGVRF